jgi:hypothetical protein
LNNAADFTLLSPLFGMTALIAVVWLRLMRDRIQEIKSKRIRLQDIATQRQLTGTLVNTHSADNFKNLFELPVLLYALCLAMHATHMQSMGLLLGAWWYVGLRAWHSHIQCTHNQVLRRFQVYVASSLLLWCLWAAFGVMLLGRLP